MIRVVLHQNVAVSSGNKMIKAGKRRNKTAGTAALALMVALAAGLALAQQPPGTPPSGQSNIPDAPSASRPVEKFPAANESITPPPPPEIATVPPGSVPQSGTGRDELFKLVTNVNFVVVPVTVKDGSGHLVEGLSRQDFRVLEDGVEQRMTFFTSDPFPLTAAVVIDLGVPEVEFRKVRDSLPALVGSFGQFDEVGLYTFGTTVQKVQDFTPAAGNKISQAMDRIRKKATARTGGPPVVGGPFGYPPSVNGRPIDPGQNPTPSYTQREAKVLNDAVLQAALDLSRGNPTRRKVIFVISDGTEYRSSATYGEVLKVLLTNQISVYAVGMSGAGIPGYGPAQKIHVPKTGLYGNILPKYAQATGGEVFSEFSASAIEAAYSRLTEEARNQYTIGYTTRATASSQYRDIEVKVDQPGLKVTAKQGYYPLPPPRQTP
jgi:VWFA-related protein